ncbi:hypothetical protein G6F45_013960 [Rhizopus arrhizus]|nr:hypothetical protein G6F45_013960 [Rhizopus arrhizus]
MSGGDAAVAAAQDDHGHQESQPGVLERRPQRQAAFAVALAQVVALGVDPHVEHLRHADEDAGHDAGDEQFAGGRIGGHGIQDHRNRRRDDHAEFRRTGLQ